MFKKITPTLEQRSDSVVKVFTDSLEEFKKINEDISSEQEKIQLELTILQNDHINLERLKDKNLKFANKLESFLNVDNG